MIFLALSAQSLNAPCLALEILLLSSGSWTGVTSGNRSNSGSSAGGVERDDDHCSILLPVCLLDRCPADPRARLARGLREVTPGSSCICSPTPGEALGVKISWTRCPFFVSKKLRDVLFLKARNVTLQFRIYVPFNSILQNSGLMLFGQSNWEEKWSIWSGTMQTFCREFNNDHFTWHHLLNFP